MDVILRYGTRVVILENPYDILKSNYTFGTIIDCVPGTGDSYSNPLMYRVKGIDGSERAYSCENIMVLRDYKIFLDSEYECCDKQIEALKRYKTQVNERIEQFESGKKVLTSVKTLKIAK